MNQGDFARCLAVLHDPQLGVLRQKAETSSLSWGAFKKERMPQGLTPTQAWRVLTAIRRQTAVVWPIRTYFDKGPGLELWHSPTHLVAERLARIDGLCGAGSSLERLLKPMGLYPYYEQVAADLHAACQRDGIEVAEEAVRAVMDGKRPPATPQERIVCNARALLDGLGEYNERAMTPGFVEELHYRLVKGSGAPMSAGLPPRYKTHRRNPYDTPTACIDALCETLRDTSDARVHPLVRICCVWSLLWDVQPLQSCNALLEVVLRHWFLGLNGLHILAYVPMGAAICQMDQRIGNAGRADTRSLEVDVRTGVDCTQPFEELLALILEGLENLHGTALNVASEEKSTIQGMAASHVLNERQRHVIHRLVANPHLWFTIQDYQRLYEVSYATARSDLLHLVDVGFLKQGKKGRAFVFTRASEHGRT